MFGMLGPAFGAKCYINGLEVTAQQQMMLASVGLPLMPGQRYWYDQCTGAWGYEGGPCMGMGVPNMPGFGALQPQASNGTTGVFINGRQLAFQDCMGLQRMGVNTIPGRYWMNAMGQFGMEGSPMPMGQVNLRAATAGGQQGGNTVHMSWPGGGNVYSSSLGNSDYYYMDTSNGNTWYPGK